ncbi:MAG TPA: HEAT repeat domain-containing protein [Deltaproteobacteria bacterium]|nr:HEAT repeat domain-containing protein [Deltaproteobacteria bacterium]
MSSIVPFDSRERLLTQAKEYISNPGLIIAEKDRAIPLLLRVLKLGELKLRRKIILLLGSFAKEDVYWPLYEIMCDPEEPDELRDQAALHLSVIGPFLDDPHALIKKLIADLKNPDTDIKVRAILALGWEGNMGAALSLIECLYDLDEEIQEVAVSALCNLKDSRVIGLLFDRMQHCSLDQKRAILFNLWRFKDKQKEITEIYRKELKQGEPSLRLDILILLGQLDNDMSHKELYRSFLKDPNPKIRALALERLGAMRSIELEHVLPFLDDPAMEVKRTAIGIVQSYKK